MPGVIIVGPAACGKSRNAPALCRHYGLAGVHEDWDGRSRLRADDLLVLVTHAPETPPKSYRVVAFDLAMREAGLANG
jgi:hypothetical protein